MTMDDRERAMKVEMLQGILEKEFGITSRAELVEAIRKMTPVDISIFVTSPVSKGELTS